MQRLTDTQQINLAVSFEDKKGNPALVDGVPSWTTSDPTVIVIEVAADGMSALAKAAGALGTAQVSLSADADLGEGVVALVGALDFEVVAGAAVVANIATGTPEEQP